MQLQDAGARGLVPRLLHRVSLLRGRGAVEGRSRVVAGAVGAVTLAFIAQVVVFRGVRLDDAYITFRYAENLARGVGFVFNPGERVMGSTSPGEAILAAAISLFSGHEALPSTMAAVGCLGWCGQAIAIHAIVRPSLGALRAFVVAGGILAGAAGSARWLPLETNVACAATLGAIALGLGGRWLLCAVACAFAGWMRPDAFLAALPLAILCLHDRRLDAWKPAVTLVALATPWPLFAWRYFGSPIPQSALAKYHRSAPLAYAAHLLRDIPNEVASASAPLAAKILFWSLAIAGVALLVRRDLRLVVLPAYAALLAGAYVVLAPDTAFTWHIYPLTMSAVSFALVAVATLVARVPSPIRVPLASLVIGACATGTVLFALRYPSDPWFGARDRVYRKVAAFLAERSAPTDIVDAEEVGTLAYYADLPMNDHARLVTPYPGDVFWKRAHGKPNNLRWLVLNTAQMKDPEWLRPLIEGRYILTLEDPPWRLWVADLKDE